MFVLSLIATTSACVVAGLVTKNLLRQLHINWELSTERDMLRRIKEEHLGEIDNLKSKYLAVTAEKNRWLDACAVSSAAIEMARKGEKPCP